MISTSGSGRASTRIVIRSSVYLPRAAFSRDSSDGVAEPRTTGMLRNLRADDGQVAGVVARRLVLFVRAVAFFVDDDAGRGAGTA